MTTTKQTDKELLASGFYWLAGITSEEYAHKALDEAGIEPWRAWTIQETEDEDGKSLQLWIH